jgi:hypothetical protein
LGCADWDTPIEEKVHKFGSCIWISDGSHILCNQ